MPVKKHHPSLEVSVDTIEVSSNRLDWVVTVARKIKHYHKAVGPLELSLMANYTMYIINNIFSDGDLTCLQDVESLTLLVRMNDPSWAVCHGINNYSSYKV